MFDGIENLKIEKQEPILVEDPSYLKSFAQIYSNILNENNNDKLV